MPAGRPSRTEVRRRENPPRLLSCIGAFDLSRPAEMARLLALLAEWSEIDKAADESGTVKVYLRRVSK